MLTPLDQTISVVWRLVPQHWEGVNLLRAVVWVQGPYLATSFLLTDMQAVQGTPCKREGTVKDLTLGPFRTYSLSGSINDVNEPITS